MKILVTGGAGFIGSNFVCSALELGHHIINIDKLTYAGNLENLENYQDHSNHVFYQEDICNRKAIEEIVFTHEPDVILHMAAESHVDRSINCADEFIKTNILGTHVLVDIALKYFRTLNNKEFFRFIHLSTDEVFGALDSSGKFDESMAYKPNSPYAASKAASDLIVRSYYRTYNFPAIIVNSSNNYGPKQYPEKLIPLMILNALALKKLPVYGEGQQVRDWLYVEDHVEALFAIFAKGKIGESYCVGSDNEIVNFDLIKLICSTLDHIRPAEIAYSDLITFVDDRLGHDFRYSTDASKLREHTGWFPKTSFSEGFRKTVHWYLNNAERLGVVNCKKMEVKVE